MVIDLQISDAELASMAIPERNHYLAQLDVMLINEGRTEAQAEARAEGAKLN